MLPVRGVSTARSFIDTAGDLCPYALDADGKPIMRNVLPHTPESDDRHVLGQRAGFDLLYPQQCGGIGGAPWRELIAVSVSSTIDGYTVGTATPVTGGSSVTSGAIQGNYIQLDSVPSSDGVGALGTGSVNATAVCPVRQGTNAAPYRLYFVSSNTTSGGFGIATIRCVRDDTGATVWTATISEASVNRYVNTMTCSDNFLFVCTNGEVKMYRVLDGSLVTTNTLNGWAQETIQAAVYKASGREWLFVVFNGSAAAGVCHPSEGHVIQAGEAATHFRSGVQRLRINNDYVNTVGPFSEDPLIAETRGWGQTITAAGVRSNAGSEYAEWDSTNSIETFYGYFRVSEHSRIGGHGCLITSIAVDSRDGSVCVTRTNQGYGPNTSGSGSDGSPFAPDGTEFPPITVFRITFAGELDWESDVGSLDSTEVGAGGYANDIPTSGSDDPTLSVSACSFMGMWAVGGRMTEAGFSLFGIDPTNGTVQWQEAVVDAGRSLRQGAICVNPGDGAFIIGGDVSDEWDAGGDDAHLWKYAALDGSLDWAFLVDAGVSVLSVSVMDDGSLVAGVDYIT